MNVSRFAKEKFRRRKRPSGSIGCGVRAPRARKSPKSAIPPSSVTRISGSPKPRVGASISAKTGPAEAEHAEIAADDVDARVARPARAARIAIAISASVAIAIGTLIRKIAAPRDRRDEPAADERADQNAIPVQAVHVPIAAPRSSPLKTTVIVASAAGVSSAPGDALQPRARRSATSRPTRPRRGREVTAEGDDADHEDTLARRRGRRASRRRGSASRASADRRRRPTAGARDRRRGLAGSRAARR